MRKLALLLLAAGWGLPLQAVAAEPSPVPSSSSPGRLERVQAAKNVRVCIWPDYYGITYRNPKTQQLSGIDIDMANELGKDLGTIETGKYADIVAVNGDPLADIRILQDKKAIHMVMKEGKVYADRRPGKSKNVVPAESWKKIDYL